MSFIIGLFTSKLAGPIASAILVLAVLFGMSQCAGRVKAERGEAVAIEARDKARSDLKTCRSNVSELTGAIIDQNEAIAAFKREGDARVAASAKAVSAARSEAERHRKSAASILAARPRGGDACTSADRLISEAVG